MKKPRVLISNSVLVPEWANWDHFNELDKKGNHVWTNDCRKLDLYRFSEGIVQGTYETFAELAKLDNSDLTGTITLTAGLGGMGGAQTTSKVTMNNGVAILCRCR